MKIKGIALIALLFYSLSAPAQGASKAQSKIEPGTYVFVSFSMNNVALKRYYLEAQKLGAKLVMRGLADEKITPSRFISTKLKLDRAKIRVDLNPLLFEALNIEQVPYIAVVDEDGGVDKIGGHIQIAKALELMNLKK